MSKNNDARVLRCKDSGKGRITDSGEVRAMDVAIGDKILFGKYAGTEIKVDGEELLVMREDDIVAVIEG